MLGNFILSVYYCTASKVTQQQLPSNHMQFGDLLGGVGKHHSQKKKVLKSKNDKDACMTEDELQN